MGEKLLYGNFDAADGLAGKTADLTGLVSNNAITVSVDGVVTAYRCTLTSALRCTNLANDNLTSLYGCATKDLNTKALTLAVAGIFGGTTGFNV